MCLIAAHRVEELSHGLRTLLGMALLASLIVDVCDAEPGLVTFRPFKIAIRRVSMVEKHNHKGTNSIKLQAMYPLQSTLSMVTA